MTPETPVGKNGLPRYVTADKQRDGSPRYRLRIPGRPQIALPGPQGSKKFWEAYHAGVAGKPAPVDPDAPARPIFKRIVAGSFRATCLRYFAECAEFLDLDQETRRVRKRIFQGMWQEPLKPGSELLFEDCPIKTFSERHVRTLRDRKRETPEAANSRLKALSMFFGWCIEENIFDRNFARDVKRFSGNKEGHHTWSVEEIAQFEARHPVGTKARLALAWLAFAGLRISDLAQIGKQHCRDGWFKKTLHKGRRRSPVTIEVPILPVLQSVIDASTCGAMLFLETEQGRQFSIKGLGNKMRTWCDEAALPHCSAHGMRKAAATIAAENGATERQLMAIFGWKDPRQAAHYTRMASQKKLAGGAMHMLAPAQNETGIVPHEPGVPSRGTITPEIARKNNASS